MKSDAIQAQFSPDDYIMLLDLVATAVDRLPASDPEAKEFVDKAMALEQQLLANAADVGMTEKDSLSGEWMPLEAVNEQFRAHRLAEIRDEDFFWDELALRLAEQTVIRRFGRDYWQTIPDSERRSLIDAEFEVIAAQLNANGIERLFVIDGEPHG